MILSVFGAEYDFLFKIFINKTKKKKYFDDRSFLPKYYLFRVSKANSCLLQLGIVYI